MAPEVINPTSTYGAKCDVWSAGIVLFMLMTGKTPYSGLGADNFGLANLAKCVCMGDIDWISADAEAADYSPGAFGFLRQLLTKDPDLRPSAEEALRHPWLQFSGN